MGVIRGSAGNYETAVRNLKKTTEKLIELFVVALRSTMPHRAGICSSGGRDFLETNCVSITLFPQSATKLTNAGNICNCT